MKRRRALQLVAQTALTAVLLAGCGFTLRGNQTFSFSKLAVLPNPGGPVAIELRHSVGDAVQVLAPDADPKQAQVVLDMLEEQREKTVVAVNTSGQVREFQLRIRVKFRLRTARGKELVPEVEIVRQQDISYTESAALAKEAEEAMLYRAMQTDIVRQIVRRLATVAYATGS